MWFGQPADLASGGQTARGWRLHHSTVLRTQAELRRIALPSQLCPPGAEVLRCQAKPLRRSRPPAKRRSCAQVQQCREHLRSSQKSSATESRSEEHTSELQSRGHLVCRLLLEK